MPSEFDGLSQKSRKVSGGHQRYQTGDQSVSTGQIWSNVTSAASDGRQVTLSEGHPWPPRSRELGDIGGPFRTSRYYITDRMGGEPLMFDQWPESFLASSGWGGRNSSGSLYRAWALRGTILPTRSLQLFEQYWENIPTIASSEQDLKTLGTTAIARCKPTSPPADLSVALGELLKEGLPAIPGVSTWKKRTEIAKGAGSEYLNTVFGWLPLVSEVQAIAAAASKQDAIWRQYRRDAGRVVRRRYEFPVEKSTTLISRDTNASPTPVPNVYIKKTSGTRTVIRHTERRTWFSGAFTYYLPKAEGEGPFGKWFNSLQKAKAVYGLTLDPETVWNLTPWSWAVDWFVNAGDVISNVSDLATDGLVMHYGYIMQHVMEVDEVNLSGYSAHKGTYPASDTLYVVRETKQRLRASPYGFGVSWDSFSPRQLAILAALGITRR